MRISDCQFACCQFACCQFTPLSLRTAMLHRRQCGKQYFWFGQLRWYFTGKSPAQGPRQRPTKHRTNTGKIPARLTKPKILFTDRVYSKTDRWTKVAVCWFLSWLAQITRRSHLLHLLSICLSAVSKQPFTRCCYYCYIWAECLVCNSHRKWWRYSLT